MLHVMFQTRILVTHGITFLPKVDQIVVMHDGHVSEVGTYEELLSRDGTFAEFIRTYLAEDNADDDSEGSEGQTHTPQHTNCFDGWKTGAFLINCVLSLIDSWDDLLCVLRTMPARLHISIIILVRY